MINSPHSPDEYDDRDLDCQVAAEDAFQELVNRMVAAGWKEEEVSKALNALSWNHMLGLKAGRMARAALSQLKS